MHYIHITKEEKENFWNILYFANKDKSDYEVSFSECCQCVVYGA